MVEKWKLALREFLKKYEEDDDVVGAILCGSYATGCQNEYSDIDVYLVLKNECNYQERACVDSNSYLVEYFMKPVWKIKEYMEDEFNNNDFSTINVFAYGKIIYDLDGSVKELQEKALQYVDRPLNVIKTSRLDDNNYHIWDDLDELKRCLKENDPQFNLIYYNLLKKVCRAYLEYLGIPTLPTNKLYRILTDEEYRRKNHVFKLPEEEFIRLYVRCFELDKPNAMYKNMEVLVNYYYEKIGGFNIRTFKSRC